MKKFYLGIDIGGTYTRLVLVEKNKIPPLWFYKFKNGTDRRRFEHRLRDAIHFAAANGDIAGIGVGLAGPLNIAKTAVLNYGSIPMLRGWNLKKFFQKYRVPVRLDNDSRLFLRAEMMRGAGRGRNYVAGIAIGTGIGGGIWLDGKMIDGAHGSAGEFGNLVMYEKSKKTFEALAAKNAYARFGDRSNAVGLGVASIINVLDPEMVILGGGGIFSSRIHMAKLVRTARKNLVNPLARETPIVKGTLGDAAQAIGAALLFSRV